jgi:hypothetical protein
MKEVGYVRLRGQADVPLTAVAILCHKVEAFGYASMMVQTVRH